jgi:peptidyl-prolyl cis-trans isomerase D
MRDHASSWLIKIILGAIVIVFVFWGVGSFRNRQAEKVAAVNEVPITAEEYRDAYNRLIDQYRQFGTNLDDEMIKKLRKQAIDGLIDQELLIQEAANLNLRVSEDELADSIRDMEVFHTDGRFDRRRYERVLSANRLTPEQFELSQKQAMLTNKVRSVIMNNVKVSDEEALEWFKWNDASVNIEYLLFEPSEYKDIEPSDEEIKSFYEKNKESYKTDPEVKVQFLHFKPETYASEAKIQPEEIEGYYETHPEEFKTEKTVAARHILIKTEDGSSPETVEEKKQKILEILAMAKEGKDFGELAKEYSEDRGSKERGGDLGEFKKGDMVPPFSEKAFSMSPGEISDPVRTQFGWHIIKVEKVNEEKTLSLDEARETITKKLTDEKAKSLAYDAAEAFYDSVFEGDDLAKLAAGQQLEVVKTDAFTKKGPAAGVKNRRKFATVAFKLEDNEISDIEDLGDGYYLIQMLEKIPEKIADLKDAEKKIRADFIKEKQDEKASEAAQECLKAVKGGSSLTDEGEKLGLTVKTTDFFKRNDSIPDIGYEREIAQAAFNLSEEKKLPENPLKGKKGYYVIRFKERKEPGQEDFEKEKASVRERLMQRKKFKTFDAWLSRLKDQSQISIEPGFAD